MNSLGKDIKSETYSKFAFPSTAVTAGGSGDNTEVDGATIDLSAIPASPRSIVFEVPFRAVLAAAATGIITSNLQDSADGSSWTDITTPAVLLTLTGGGGGTTEVGVARIGYDLSKARRYVRIQATPNLSATSVDTAVMGAAVALFGGLAELPQ